MEDQRLPFLSPRNYSRELVHHVMLTEIIWSLRKSVKMKREEQRKWNVPTNWKGWKKHVNEKKKEMQTEKQKIEREEAELEAEEKKQHDCLKNTESLLKEAEQKLADSISAKDFDKASVSQAMLEIANKRIAGANSSLLELEAKRTKLQARKHKLASGTIEKPSRDDAAKTKRPAESASSAAKRHCVDK